MLFFIDLLPVILRIHCISKAIQRMIFNRLAVWSYTFAVCKNDTKSEYLYYFTEPDK